MKLSHVTRLLVVGITLLSLSGCGSVPPPLLTPPAGGVPISDVAQLKGTWVGQSVNFYGRPDIFYVRFDATGGCTLISYSDFRGPRRFWIATSTARIHTDPTGAKLMVFERMQTLAGAGVLGGGSDLYQPATLWMEDGRLYFGQKHYFGVAAFTRAPALDSVDLAQYAAMHMTNDQVQPPTDNFMTGALQLQQGINGLKTSQPAPNTAFQGQSASHVVTDAVANAVETTLDATDPSGNSSKSFAAGYAGGATAVTDAKSGMNKTQAALNGINQAAQTLVDPGAGSPANAGSGESGPGPVSGLSGAQASWQTLDAAGVTEVGGWLYDVQGHLPNTSGSENINFRWGIMYGVSQATARSLVESSTAITADAAKTSIGYRRYKVTANGRYYVGVAWYPTDNPPSLRAGFTTGSP